MAKITKTIYLFGQRIDAEVEEDDDQRPTVTTRGGLELPHGAFLVAEKTLTESDVNSGQGRLLIPDSPEMEEFLTGPERSLVATPKQGIRLKAMDNNGKTQELNLIEWPSVKTLVLNRGWNKVVEENKLRESDKIGLWFYRQNNELRCAVDICERGRRPAPATGVKVEEKNLIQ